MTDVTDFELPHAPRARSTDPATSHAAADAVRQFGAGQCRTVLLSLLETGPGTIDEIALRTGLTPVQVARRLPDLQLGRRARPTDRTRPGAGGRAQRVWEAA